MFAGWTSRRRLKEVNFNIGKGTVRVTRFQFRTIFKSSIFTSYHHHATLSTPSKRALDDNHGHMAIAKVEKAIILAQILYHDINAWDTAAAYDEHSLLHRTPLVTVAVSTVVCTTLYQVVEHLLGSRSTAMRSDTSPGARESRLLMEESTANFQNHFNGIDSKVLAQINR